MTTQGANGLLLEPVGIVRSPYREKFGAPRQPGLANSALGEVRLLAGYADPAMLDGLQGFSHLWLIFGFDRCAGQGWKPHVRPPRLGGNREVGVWASRSPFRPNGLGLSVVRLLAVTTQPAPVLQVAGLDILDGTPVYDIKPYVPYADAIPGARAGYAEDRPQAVLAVGFTPSAEAALAALPDPAAARRLIEEVLALDPRPAYRSGPEPGRTYGCLLGDLNVRWQVTAAGVMVQSIEPA